MQHDARLVPVDTLKPYGKNPRRGDVDAIRASLRANGQYRPVVVRAKTGEVLAGNHTLKAAQAEGWTELWATFVDCDAKTAKRIVLVDNRSNDLAGYDNAELIDLLQSLPSLEGTGYDQAALDDLLAQTTILDDAGRDTDPGAPPAEPVTQPGDRIVLGDHVLLCGDSTRADHVESLMGGVAGHAMWTDPPYGVSYVGKTKRALTIKNDDADNLDALLRDAFAISDTALMPGAAIYVAHPAGALGITFGMRFLKQGWRLHQGLVWVKDSMVLGHADYHYKHEPILYGYKPGGGRRGRGGDGWYGDNSQVSVLEFAKPTSSPDHPTSKPVDLIEHCLRNSSAPGHVVLDPFGGSGSTLIAAENLGRCARVVELDPGYCDVIVDRWERHTGQRAQRPER